MENISLLAAFVAGIISYVSPCILPLVPMYISFISGMSLEELGRGHDRKQILGHVAISSLLFVLGFSIIFVGLGASATFTGRLLLAKLSILRKAAGVVIIILGLHVAGVFRLRFLNYEKRFHLVNSSAGFMRPFLAGLAFAFGWTPCVGPVLSAILIYSSSQETVWQGVWLLSMYSLGLGIPFFLTGMSINAFLSFLKRIRRYYKVIEIITGAFLVIMGILFIIGYFDVLPSFMAKLFPWLLKG